MAFDPTVATWFPDWECDGTDITVPLASFPEMSSAEAGWDSGAVDGDIRKVVYAILEKLYKQKLILENPAMMTVNKGTSVNTVTGDITHIYTVRFTNTIASQDVKDEPA